MVGLTRRALSAFELVRGSWAVPPLPSTASSPSRAVCMREYAPSPVDFSSSSGISSSPASDCEAELVFSGSSPALLAISGLFRSPIILISTSSPWEGSGLGRRPERSGDDDFARCDRYSGEGEGLMFTNLGRSGGVRFKPSSSEP